MLIEESMESLGTVQSEELLETSALGVMNEMFGNDVVSSVRNLAVEMKDYVIQINPQDFSDALVFGGIGAVAGLTLGIMLTRTYEQMEEKRTGNKPVPRLGIGCAIVPKAAMIGAIGGFVGRLIFS